MKFIITTLAGVFILLSGSVSIADDAEPYAKAFRIVVFTADEGIIFANACRFYELRDILAESAINVSAEHRETGNAHVFEIRMLGKDGEHTLYVGDRWIASPDGMTHIDAARYKRIADIVAERKGQGGPKDTVKALIGRYLADIKDPNYVEDNRCHSYVGSR